MTSVNGISQDREFFAKLKMLLVVLGSRVGISRSVAQERVYSIPWKKPVPDFL